MIFSENALQELNAKKYEILGELELAKQAMLREMSGVDKCTLTKLRQIVKHYEDTEKLIIDKVNNLETQLFKIVNGGIGNDCECDNEHLLSMINEIKTSIETQSKTIENMLITDETLINSNKEMTTTFNNLSKELDNEKSVNKWVFIGDSFGSVENSWVNQLAVHLGLSSDMFYNLSKGSAGFATTIKFIDLLASASLPNEEIKHIVVCGGYNDRGYSQSVIGTAIESFMTYVKTYFPNAKVYIGMLAWGRKYEQRASIFNNVLPAYNNYMKLGYTYLNGVEDVLHDYRLIGEDNIHPTTNGQTRLALAIYHALKSGAYFMPWEMNGVDFEPLIVGCSDSFKLQEVKEGKNIRAFTSSAIVTLNISAKTIAENSIIKLGEFPLNGGFIMGMPAKEYFSCRTFVHLYGDKNETVPAVFYILSDDSGNFKPKLYMKIVGNSSNAHTNVTKIDIHDLNFECQSWYA